MSTHNEWYSRRHIGLAAAVLVLTGTWTAIAFLPSILLALVLFTLIGGPGLFIAYKQKMLLLIIGVTSLVPAWVYLWFMLIGARSYYALFYDLGTIVFVPLIASGFATLIWLAWRKRAPTSKMAADFRKPVLFTFFALFVVVPFVVAALHDYNVRADTSSTEAVTMKVVATYMATDLDGDHFPAMTLESLDGDLRFDYAIWYGWTQSPIDVGDYCVVFVHSGALGYPWTEGYRAASLADLP